MRLGVSLIVVAFVLCVMGCGGSHRRSQASKGTDVTVVVSKEAALAARRNGIDLRELVARSAERAFSLLPHRGRVRIDVGLDAARAIPGVGVGGYTDPATGNVSIWIDPSPPDGLRTALETWIPGAVAHELDHSSRIRTGPGYGITLGEAIVSEGLADQFERQAFPKTPPQPWDHALTKAQERSVWLLARPQLDSDGYDHTAWFFGGGSVPPWASYTLGYDIVGRYLDHRRSASNAVDADATKIIKAFRGF